MKFGMDMRLYIRGGGKTVWGIYRISPIRECILYQTMEVATARCSAYFFFFVLSTTSIHCVFNPRRASAASKTRL